MALIMAVIGACTALWTKHGITEVEAIIASQATLLSNGGGLYYDLNAYPFTVSPYGPLLYGLEAVSVLAGFAPIQQRAVWGHGEWVRIEVIVEPAAIA